MPNCVLLWFRRDLRLQDNPAVTAALTAGCPILPVYIHDDAMETRPLGAASRWWLDKSLHVLHEELAAFESRLTIATGSAFVVLVDLCKTYNIKEIYASRTFDPIGDAMDEELSEALGDAGVNLRVFHNHLLVPPGETRTQGGDPFKVFTPYFNSLSKSGKFDIASMPANPQRPWPAPQTWPASLSIADLDLYPHPTRSGKDWSAGFTHFTPGERGARKALRHFLRENLRHYAEDRDRPDLDATSHLSPHLRFGEISPLRIVYELHKTVRAAPDLASQAKKFCAELAWREFSYDLLHQVPHLHDRNFRDRFDAMPWRDDESSFRAWRQGKTGYDLVDAGMQELWQTGYMHNRVRMICASFLTKHLLIDWRRGEQWFWDCLLDADPANNPASWQWVAGSGADAAPYFRIFNPITQAAKFDPNGQYRALYLGGDPSIYMQADKAGRPNALASRPPIVDHGFARQRALDAYHGYVQTHEPD